MAFKDTIWWTRKARIQTEKRLISNAFHSNLLLLWYAFSGVAASIYHLNFAQNTNINNLSNISWVIYSVLVLCMSGFINGLSFRRRAALIKECYETLNRLHQRAKQADVNEVALAAEYEQILGVCENHTDVDYYRALCEAYLTHPDPKNTENEEIKLDRLPTRYQWLVVVWSIIKRLVMLLFLYIIPIILFIILEKWV